MLCIKIGILVCFTVLLFTAEFVHATPACADAAQERAQRKAKRDKSFCKKFSLRALKQADSQKKSKDEVLEVYHVEFSCKNAAIQKKYEVKTLRVSNTCRVLEVRLISY